ncbi:MAG: metalloregulator ArsR/SmtB family transcription factor [Caulobacterales bacterium]|nr:metalloregulator ArsR/SmtB family transcription factor [Caulobacterales bacterium]
MEQAIAALRAVGEATRLRIVTVLRRGELTVSELVQVLGQSQPRVSRHLRLLAEAGVVERLPEGSWVFYRLSEHAPGVRDIVEAAVGAVALDDAVLRGDSARLDAVKKARAAAAAEYFRAVAGEWDRIRALHLPEAEVEEAMRAAAGEGPFELMIDVGTGSGRILQVFADRATRGVGVDLSHEMLNVARHNLEEAGLVNCSVRHADLYALPFPDKSADLATIHMVLHYLDDPAGAVAEAARVARPGGAVVIVDFAAHDLEALRDHHAHRRLGFADEEVAGWAAQAGLAPEPPRALAPKSEGLTVKVWRARRP